MRSLLFAPGSSAKMMANALTSAADIVIFDLEDAVHPDAKREARRLQPLLSRSTLEASLLVNGWPI